MHTNNEQHRAWAKMSIEFVDCGKKGLQGFTYIRLQPLLGIAFDFINQIPSNTSESCSQCINFGLVYFQLSKTASCWGLCGGDGCTRPHGYLNKYHSYHFKHFEYLRTAWFIQIHQILSPHVPLFSWCFVFAISQLFSISLFEVAFHNVRWALAWSAQGALWAPCDEKGVCWSTKNMAYPMLPEPCPPNFGTWFINVHLIFADSAC